MSLTEWKLRMRMIQSKWIQAKILLFWKLVINRKLYHNHTIPAKSSNIRSYRSSRHPILWPNFCFLHSGVIHLRRKTRWGWKNHLQSSNQVESHVGASSLADPRWHWSLSSALGQATGAWHPNVWTHPEGFKMFGYMGHVMLSCLVETPSLFLWGRVHSKLSLYYTWCQVQSTRLISGNMNECDSARTSFEF